VLAGKRDGRDLLGHTLRMETGDWLVTGSTHEHTTLRLRRLSDYAKADVTMAIILRGLALGIVEEQ